MTIYTSETMRVHLMARAPSRLSINSPFRPSAACSAWAAPLWCWPATRPRPRPCAPFSRTTSPPSTQSRHIGIFATPGTIRSQTYDIEIGKLFPDIKVTGQACPMWVPLIENGEYRDDGADYFVRKYINQLLSRDPDIDAIILGCTHYPLLYDKIRHFTPSDIRLISQGEYVAKSLADYFGRHRDMESRITRNGRIRFLTTENPTSFSDNATCFLGSSVEAERVSL